MTIAHQENFMATPPSSIDLLACLRAYGQRVDFELAQELRVTIEEVHERVAALIAAGEVIECNLTRFQHGRRIEAMMYRVRGYMPPVGRGRKTQPPAK
jgi:hypothetical protein